jgi:hypothetical protein
MPRRRAINDVSIAYKPYLLEFMAFYHERVQPYPRETVFEQDVLVAIKPRDIERWMCKKAYGVTDPGLDDHPIHGRSSSLEFYKKALSYFMPNKRMGWNEVTQAGNPTKSSEIIDRIKKVKKEEVRKTGKKSSARRPLEHREFKQSLAILERDPDPIKRFLAPCVNKVQYNLIARLDDAMELEFEDIKPNLHFPFSLLVHMCWSKNVNEERDAGEQILLGSMRREYCILLALAMYLEVWIGSGNGMLGTLLFNIVEDDPKKSKKRVADIMAEVYKHRDFERIKEGPVGTHSVRKLPATHARRFGCSRDDTDHRGRWRRKKRQSDDYVDMVLPYPDAKVASKLCIGGPCMYALKADCGVSDDWLAEFVVPNIRRRFPREVGMVLGRALLWACFDAEVKEILPPALSDRIRTAYAAIRRLPEGENPVKKVLLVVTGDDDQLNIEEIGGPDDADANQPAARRQMGSTREELLALHSQNAGLRREIEELRTQQSLLAQRMEGNFTRLNRNIRRIAVQPAQRVRAMNVENENNNGDNYVSTLSPTPRTLYILWQEYEFGIGGRKPARLFTPAERGKVKYSYHRRKVVWDVIASLVRAGDTAQVAIDRIYEVYGAAMTVSHIINMMRRDRRTYNGCHPQLRV